MYRGGSGFRIYLLTYHSCALLLIEDYSQLCDCLICFEAIDSTCEIRVFMKRFYHLLIQQSLNYHQCCSIGDDFGVILVDVDIVDDRS